jgi:hypothetical protein
MNHLIVRPADQTLEVVKAAIAFPSQVSEAGAEVIIAGNPQA